MNDLVIAALALGSGGFCLCAVIGVLRFPDALSRMHASSKAGGMGGTLALLAAAMAAGTGSAWMRAVLAILFLLLTAPVAAHLLGRAAAWRAGAGTGAPEGSPDETPR